MCLSAVSTFSWDSMSLDEEPNAPRSDRVGRANLVLLTACIRMTANAAGKHPPLCRRGSADIYKGAIPRSYSAIVAVHEGATNILSPRNSCHLTATSLPLTLTMFFIWVRVSVALSNIHGVSLFYSYLQRVKHATPKGDVCVHIEPMSGPM